METLGQILAVVDDEKQQQRLREVLHDATLTFVRDEREALVAAVMGGVGHVWGALAGAGSAMTRRCRAQPSACQGVPTEH